MFSILRSLASGVLALLALAAALLSIVFLVAEGSTIVRGSPTLWFGFIVYAALLVTGSLGAMVLARIAGALMSAPSSHAPEGVKR